MSNLQETPAWVDGIYQLTEETPVLGKQADIPGDGPANLQAQQLANRTQFLRQAVDGIQSGDTPYTSPEAAQQAINSGKLPANSKFSVRLGSADVWVAEYQNLNNVATPTGKVYPTKTFIDNSIKGMNLSLENVSEYLNLPYKIHQEFPRTGNWSVNNTSGWAVGIESDGSVINFIDFWVGGISAIDHVTVKVYSRSVDGPAIFPGAETDTLLSASDLKMSEIAMVDSGTLGYQLIRFRVPPVIVPAGGIVLFVVQPYDSQGQAIFMGNSNVSVTATDAPGLINSLGGFWIDVAQTIWKAVTNTSTSLLRIAFRVGFQSNAAEDELAFIKNKKTLVSIDNNSQSYQVGATGSTQWYGWAVGFPGKSGFDVVTLYHQNLNAVDHIRYRVVLRPTAAAMSGIALGLGSGDRQIFSGIVYPPADVGTFTAVEYPIPGLIIPDGYFAAIEVHAFNADGSFAFFGCGAHSYASGTAPADIALGYYLSVAQGTWRIISGTTGLAWSLTKADWQSVSEHAKTLTKNQADSAAKMAALESTLIGMNSYDTVTTRNDESGSAQWSYSTMAEAARFYRWAVPIHNAMSQLRSMKMWLDGLSLNARVECNVFFRANSLKTSTTGPGATGDTLALTADVQGLPSSPAMTLVTLPINNLDIPDGYFPIITVTAYYTGGTVGNLGCGSKQHSSADMPQASELGWYSRADRAGWAQPTAGAMSSVAYTTEMSAWQDLQTKIADLEGEIAGSVPLLDLLFPATLYNVANDIDYKVSGQTYTGPRVALTRNFSAVLHIDNFIPYTDKEPSIRFGNGSIRKIVPAYSPVITAGAIENPNLNGGQNIYEETVSYSVNGNQPAKQERTLINRSVLNSASKDKTPTILIIGDSVSFGQDAYFPDNNAKWNYTMILNRMFAGDKQQNGGAGYGFRTVGTISYTDIDGQKTFNEAYSGTTLQGTGLFNNPKFLDSSGAFSFANWLLKYRTCNANGQRLYFDANRSTAGTAGTNNKGYLEDGSDSGLLIGSTISNTLSIDVYEPTHVFCFHCSNGAISKADYDLFITRVRNTFPAAVIGLGTPHVAGTYFPSHYPDVYRPAIWEYDQTYNNRQVATARVLLANYCNTAAENNKVFVLPTMWVTPAAHAFSCITINEPWRDIIDGDDLLMPVGQRVDVHVGSKAQAAYAQQIYAWLKWTAVKGLF